MNISALWVCVFAVMSTYVYADIHCSDCNRPCSSHQLHNAKKEFTKVMNVPHCGKNNNISYKANPQWECVYVQIDDDIDRTPPSYSYAKCGQCKNEEEAMPILQDFNMLFKRSCKSTHNHTLYVLELKPVTVSLGCTCVKR